MFSHLWNLFVKYSILNFAQYVCNFHWKLEYQFVHYLYNCCNINFTSPKINLWTTVDVLKAQPSTIVETVAPITIRSDTHRWFNNVILFKCNGWLPKTRCLFLGKKNEMVIIGFTDILLFHVLCYFWKCPTFILLFGHVSYFVLSLPKERATRYKTLCKTPTVSIYRFTLLMILWKLTGTIIVGCFLHSITLYVDYFFLTFSHQ